MSTSRSAPPPPSLGSFLEIAVGIDAPAEALATFGALGLREVPVADATPGPRAVVSDGRLSIGLHDASFEGPKPVFVRPDLQQHLAALEAAGVGFETVDVAHDRFHRASFRDPNDLEIMLIEARTFAPVQRASSGVAACGKFVELSVSTHSSDESAAFWRALGFSIVSEGSSPYRWVRLEGHGFALGLHEAGGFRFALTFRAPQLEARVAYLRAKGFEPRRSSPLAAGSPSATLLAPGGLEFFLLDDDEDAA
jgi:hypothetical protein